MLLREGEVVELSARYFDALVLLARHPGSLITKERFFDEVWHGVPVTDEALTQCVRTLRKALGDAATQPRFIETVPKHGYRFVADPHQVAADPAPSAANAKPVVSSSLIGPVGGGTLGAGTAGALVGMIYGLSLATASAGSSGGRLSLVLVMICVGALAGLVAGLGIAGGIGLAWRNLSDGLAALALGGALGGLLTGGIGRLIGMDAFSLLLGHSPHDITGATEGAIAGLACGCGVWLGTRRRGLLQQLLPGAIIGVGIGAGLILSGGLLLGGSLAALAEAFPGSTLRLADESVPLRAVFGALEAALFVTGLIAGMIFGGLRRADDKG
ncbi:transcriptional regulator [Erythrobacter sp. LQ02-29]|uniref:winged helix-turn-helix domain-containing protein n=1 Tax=Erythrobacter sp. LQ02-29 TaxID=2920384 RepID=UPI001F4DD0AB|nr:transcriptional regulator [Erythrobacter sp. LQ02-29]MCP9223361.1 transcriptional regulator [Erythrobacter sp. LQ02-29]